MLLQTVLLVLIGMNNAWGANQDIGEYLQQHSKLSLITDQLTAWDRSSLPADKDITYPVENHPVPEIRIRLRENGEKMGKRRPKTRARRQISPDSCYLFFANRAHLIQFQNAPTFRINVALTGFSNAVAVDFDKTDGYLFWSDVSEQKIYRSSVNGSDLRVLVDSNITTPDGIAWDWVNKKLYWTDYADRDLEVLDVYTGCREKIFQFDDTSKPRAIVVDPSTRWMYWTDWGSPAKIERASMDGSSRTLLHTTDLWWPNALTMDYGSQRLYWLDAAVDRLESSNADGSGRVLLSTTHIYHPFGVTFFQGLLFWSDWHLKALLAAPVSNVSAKSIILGDLTLDPMGMVAACAERQEMVANPCDGKCNDLCLLSTKLQGYTCLCADNCVSPDAECEESCGENGQCTGHNLCTCNDGWRGATCNQGLCAGGCIHGDCVAPDVCSCDAGWSGDKCDQAVCCSECVGGSCTSPGVCTCNYGWTGSNCDIQLETCSVPRGCLNGGSCKSTFCDCPSGYGGDRCELICSIQQC